MDWMTLKIGDKIVEYCYGTSISSIVKTAPEQKNGQITFDSETEDGKTINYLMTIGYFHYAPEISLDNRS